MIGPIGLVDIYKDKLSLSSSVRDYVGVLLHKECVEAIEAGGKV